MLWDYLTPSRQHHHQSGWTSHLPLLHRHHRDDDHGHELLSTGSAFMAGVVGGIVATLVVMQLQKVTRRTINNRRARRNGGNGHGGRMHDGNRDLEMGHGTEEGFGSSSPEIYSRSRSTSDDI